MKRADSLLTPFIKNLGIEDGLRLAEIKKNWSLFFDRPLSYHMIPIKLSKGELLLNVDSPAWLQELNFYREDILKKLSSYGIKTIRFKLGKVSVTEKSESRDKRSEDKQLKSEERLYIEKTASKIYDEALRVSVKQAMRKAITSGKTKIL